MNENELIEELRSLLKEKKNLRRQMDQIDTKIGFIRLNLDVCTVEKKRSNYNY